MFCQLMPALQRIALHFGDLDADLTWLAVSTRMLFKTFEATPPTC